MNLQMKDMLVRKIGPTFLCFLVVTVSLSKSFSQEVALPEGTALRIKLLHRVRIRTGATVIGVLTQPVFLVDHEVVPAGAVVSGTIRGTHADTRKEHIRRLLAGDFTPLRIPEIVFDSLTMPARGKLPAHTVAIDAPAEETTARLLTLGTSSKKRSLAGQAKDAIRQKEEDLQGVLKQTRHPKDTLKHYPYLETVERWAVRQLPYHPLIIWSDARFNADLTHPVSIPDVPHVQLPTADLHGHLPQAPLRVRLLSPLTSASAKRGDLVLAVTTQPVFASDHTEVLVPEGTRLLGKVLYVKPARAFGRNGSLRFAFTRLDLPEAELQSGLEIHGEIAAAATAPGEHVTIDDEGEMKANSGPGKYVEPLLLVALAAHAAPDDGRNASSTADVGSATTSSNGFGLIARVVALSTRDTSVIQGFAYYALAKSLYYNFIDKGHETTFPHDTDMQVSLSER